MKKEDRIKETLTNLIETLPLKEITVQKICHEGNIKRQTFYYHYKSIYDVLVDFFLNEEIPGINDTVNWAALIHSILLYVGNHRQLVLKTLKSDASDIVESFFYNRLFKQGRKFIEAGYHYSLDKNEITEVAKLMSDALSREMSRLLVSPHELSISAIEESISKTFDGVLDLICTNKVKQRAKKGK